MLRLLARAFCLIIAIASTSCAQIDAPSTQVLIAPDVTLSLPSAALLGVTTDVAQWVTARHGNDSFMFEGRLSVDPVGLTLVGADSLGRRALTITWTDKILATDKAAWLPDSVPPANILADIMLIYWPIAVLNQHLHGATVTESQGHRVLRAADQDIAIISPALPLWSGPARLRHLVWDYSLEIQSAQVAP